MVCITSFAQEEVIQMNYTTLKTEIDTDPENLGYAGKTDKEIVSLLSEIGLSSETISRGVIDAHEVVSACVFSELDALSDKQQKQLSFIVSAGQVDTSNVKIKAIFAGLFNGTQTKTNLLALATRSASRGEAEFGQNPSLMDVHIARRI